MGEDSRGSEVLSRLQADALHMEYMQTASSAIREKLLDYSRDDVDGLVQLCEFLRGLAASDKWPEPYRFRDALEIIDFAFEQPITPHARPLRPMRPQRPNMPQEVYDTLTAARQLRLQRLPRGGLGSPPATPSEDSRNLGNGTLGGT